MFLVGCAHAYKSKQKGFASSADGTEEGFTAGAQIADRVGKDNVFTVFQHVLSGDNNGENKSPIRGGIFDLAFERMVTDLLGLGWQGLLLAMNLSMVFMKSNTTRLQEIMRIISMVICFYPH
ncbi:MAG: hypothetical protein K2M94_03005 [Paramuribaculum sp.]|nr:hypothetical protein [Paramuribaculum sp.]